MPKPLWAATYITPAPGAVTSPHWTLTRQGVSTSHSGAAHVAFEGMKTLGPCDV